ncbi:MAG: phasin family protein [Beijerinckiaceae bacterium]
MAQKQQTGPIGTEAFGLAALTQSTQSTLASAMASPQKFAELTSEAMAEWMTFVSRRANAQAELFGELSHCHDVDQAADTQRRFVAKCTKDYTDEFTQLLEIGRRNVERISKLTQPNGQAAGSNGGAA